MVGTCLGTDNIPGGLSAYRTWMQTWLPGGGLIHTFGFVAICWTIWKARNKACFDKKMIKHPAEILIHACALMNYWAGLYASHFQEIIIDGVKILISCAHRVLAQQGRPVIVSRLLAPADDQESDETDEDGDQ